MWFLYFILALVLLINAVIAQSNIPRPATLPPPRDLSVLGITSGSIIALRTMYMPALEKDQGYLTECDQCHQDHDKLATYHGTTRFATPSQFKVEVYWSNSWGYPTITLQNMYSQEYLTIASSSTGGAYGSFTKNDKYFMSRWAAVVVTYDEKNFYLALMDSIPGMLNDPHFAKLCDGCLTGGEYVLDLAPENGAGLRDYHVFAVERVS
ncbi:MAG: hypothetical protein J3Q66DRAFT_400438 [Benniella sp.]|nr:MAG: hypothetical protein J3Q66DRAFT_400438 [Benniella sp.]